MRRAHLIGIAGPSCSGKTTLARLLAKRLQPGAILFGLDSYYHDFSGVEEARINVDVPEALESDLIVSHLQELAAGRAIERPVYDYATHSRAPRGSRVEPAPYVVVEGLYALYWDDLFAMLDTSVFVDLDHDTCLERRIARDTRERGRSAQSVIDVYVTKVRPNYERFVLPTRARAGMVLDGRESAETLVLSILEEVRAGA